MLHRGSLSITICCIFLASVAGPGAAQGAPPSADFFVAPWGNDISPGTFEAPFATLARARDAVRTLIAAGLTDHVTVLLRGGTYKITQPVMFGLQDSCPDPYTVTYAAYPSEEPTVSGGRSISGWTAQGDGTWTVTLADVASGAWTFRELFVNGVRRQRARHPNDGFLLVAGPVPDEPPETRFKFAFSQGDLPPETDLAGGELLFLHDWNTSRVRIDHVDHALGVLTTAQPIGVNEFMYVFSQLDHPRYAVENDLALMDAPGEWYLDEQTGELTYLPMPGEDIGNVDAVAPIAEALLTVRGDGDTEQFVHNLRFVGIAFEHCAWALPEGGYAETQAGYYFNRDFPAPYELPSALTFELADSCEVEDGRIAHVGGWGIMFGRSCRDCAFVGNVVTDIAGNGIMIGEDKSREVPHPVEDTIPWWEFRPDQAASGNVIRNNLIQYTGQVLHGTDGIWVGMANTTTVSHNLIRYMPSVGISAGWVFAPTPSPVWGNTIEYNHLHDVMLMLTDSGGIYTLGLQPLTVLHGNLIHDLPPSVGRLLYSNAIACDEDSAHLVVDSNAMFNLGNAPMRFHIGGYSIVSNNMLINDDDLQPTYEFIATDPANIKRVNNVPRIEEAGVSCGDVVWDVAPLAGLEPTYRARLLGGGYGIVAPNECLCLTCQGDVNASSTVDAEDIQGFVSAAVDGPYSSCADIDQDGAVDSADIPAFVQLLMGGIPCSDPPIGACCVSNGSCSEATDIDCATAGGTFHGDGSTCAPGLCPQPIGICCLCEQCERLDEQTCITQGGTFFRVVLACEDVEPCPTLPIGACCHPDDTCDIRTQCSCENLGGFYFGDLTDCSAGTPSVYSASPGLPIDGSQTVVHTINVPDSFVIGDVNVQLDLPHTWVGDLRVTVEHLGQSVLIMNRLQDGVCADDLVSIVLDDEGAGGPVEEKCSVDYVSIFPTSPPNYIPDAPLMAFEGLDAAGDWTIMIDDEYPPDDNGLLDAWTLFLDVFDEEICADVP